MGNDSIKGILRGISAQTCYTGQDAGFSVLFSGFLNIAGCNAAVKENQAFLAWRYGGRVNGLRNDSGCAVQNGTQQHPDENQDFCHFRFHFFSLKTLFS
jgi:hypothetical protein